MKDSIALIGFMGSGKTAVGRALARKLHKEFIEVDAEIERIAGKPIWQIFRDDGEIRFREIEIEATRMVSEKQNAVIACGGGIVVNKINTDRLKIHSIIVYLTASVQAILRRTEGDSDRPLLNVADRRRQVEELLRFRKPFYERAADIIINTNRMGVDEVVEEAVEKLKAYEAVNR